jgi:hypothetical protein
MTMAEFVPPLLRTKDPRNVIVTCEEKTFECDKDILAGRSEVRYDV